MLGLKERVGRRWLSLCQQHLQTGCQRYCIEIVAAYIRGTIRA